MIGPRPAHLGFVLDNDVLNDWRNGKSSTVQAISDYIARVKGPPALTSMTVFEMLYGFEKSAVIAGLMSDRTKADKRDAQSLTRNCRILPFNEEAAGIAAYIYARLSPKQQSGHFRDVMIAATALAHDNGVITRNRQDFELIAKHVPAHRPALRLEIWS